MKSTLVKIFLVLNLILCAVVLGFSFKTFSDRELVKARTVIHRESIQKIAENLDWGDDVSGEEATDRKAGAFVLPKPQKLNDITTFAAILEELSELAEKRVAQLGRDYSELIETQSELEVVQTELDGKIADLASTRSRVASMESTISDGKKSIRDFETESASLERENNAIQQQLDGVEKQLTNQQTLVSQVSTELALRTGERDRIEELLEACRRPVVDNGGTDAEWHQKTALILAVEPEWNYVVINRGEVDVLPMFLEAFVHRDDQFIGKIRVMQVENTVSLAEIVPESLTPGMSIEAGDTIFF
jgi:hypothetical protein